MQAAIQPKIVKSVPLTRSPKAEQPTTATSGEKQALGFFDYLRMALAGVPA